MKPMNLSQMFDRKSGFRPSTPAERRRRFYPNSAYMNDREGVGVIVCWYSETHGTFSLKVENLHSLLRAREAGKIRNGYVALAFGGESAPPESGPVASSTIAEVWRLLKDVEPKDGQHGAFWVLTEEFAVAMYERRAADSRYAQDLPF